MLGLLSACSNDVTGQVFFDANQDGQANELTPMAGVPVELFLVSKSKSSGGFTVTAAPTANTDTAKVTKNHEADEASSDTSDGDDPLSEEEGTEEADTSDPSAMDANLNMILPSTAAPVPAPDGSGDFVAMKMTDHEGKFRFGKLEPGTYEVRIADTQGPLAQGFRVTTGENPREVSAQFAGADVSIGLFRQGLDVIGGDCPNSIAAGETLRCELHYENISPTAMGSVRVRAKLPHGVLAIPLDNGVFHEASREVEWDLGFVPAKQVVQVRMDLRVHQLTAPIRNGTIDWRLHSAGVDDVVSLGSSPLTLHAQPGLQIDILGASSASVGEPVSYEVLVRNYGNMHLGQGVLKLSVNQAVTQVQTEGGFDSAAGELSWPIPALGVGEQTARYFTLTPSESGELTITGTLSGATLDSEHVSVQSVVTEVQSHE